MKSASFAVGGEGYSEQSPTGTTPDCQSEFWLRLNPARKSLDGRTGDSCVSCVLSPPVASTAKLFGCLSRTRIGVEQNCYSPIRFLACRSAAKLGVRRLSDLTYPCFEDARLFGYADAAVLTFADTSKETFKEKVPSIGIIKDSSDPTDLVGVRQVVFLPAHEGVGRTTPGSQIQVRLVRPHLTHWSRQDSFRSLLRMHALQS